MTKVYQTRGGDTGNCWPACLASILEISLDEVDHCSAHHDDFFARTQAFLAQRGMFYLEMPVNPQSREGYPFSQVPEGALVIGGDLSGRLEHAVVMRAEHWSNGELAFIIIHDPHRPDGSFRNDYDIRRIMFLCRLFR